MNETNKIIVQVFRAQECGVELVITSSHDFPADLTPRMGQLQHEDDATKIVDALYKVLPGGTLDRVVWLLLEKQASRYRVSYEQLR